MFKRKNLFNRGVPESKIEELIENSDYLVNLQLLEGMPNIEKSNKDFREWLFETYPDQQRRKEYMKKNYIPAVELSLENFDEFFVERTKLMKRKFTDLLKT